MVNTIYSADERAAAPSMASLSGVSWAAIFAGALAAAVLSLLLFILGIGLGLSSVSVWSSKGVDGDAVGWSAVAWIAFTQLASAGVGGYIAGRLRTRWQGIHTDEVYFRDTAHGFLSWGLATLLMVALMGSVIGSAVTGTAKAAGAVASGAASIAGGAAGAVGGVVQTAASSAAGALGAKAGDDSNSSNGMGYWINSLFRTGGLSEDQKDQLKVDANQAVQKARSTADVTQEVTGIYVQALKNGKLSDDDSVYIAQLISQRTNLSTEEAQKKVEKSFQQVQEQIEKTKQAAKEAEEKAKQAAETARKATAYSMLWLFVALMIGAFVGSLCATWGGRSRDAV